MRERPDIETELCDLADMAKVADILVEMARNEMAAAAKREISAKQAADHVEYWAAAASFAVVQTKIMAAKLRNAYEDALVEDRQGRKAVDTVLGATVR